jgi:choline kinase
MTDNLHVVILAAGMGTRLGMPHPKPLTPLADGRSILARQLENLRQVFGDRLRVTIVVGFHAEQVMAAAPEAVFAYNERYGQTNTAKSLLRALRVGAAGGVLWLNGDVVFDPRLLERISPVIEADHSFVCVNTEAVGEEEVKYTATVDGYVLELSKSVIAGLGEAVGINYVASSDRAALVEHLEGCSDTDYFERGIETAIAVAGMRVLALDISEFFVVEVDFAGDLERANVEVGRTVTSAA